MNEPRPLEEARVAALCALLFAQVRKHLGEGRPSRDKVLEALNALAGVAATLVIGTADEAAMRFFLDAFRQNLTDNLHMGEAEYADPSTHS